jgi:hypothetical protein
MPVTIFEDEQIKPRQFIKIGWPAFLSTLHEDAAALHTKLRGHACVWNHPNCKSLTHRLCKNAED